MTVKTFEVRLSASYITMWLQACEGEGATSSGLNENCSHRLVYFNVWLPVGVLFRKDQEVWPYCGSCVTGSGI